MDDNLLHELGKALRSLEVEGPIIDELVFPSRRSVSTEPVSGACAGSRPPVSIPIVDLKAETEKLLGFWCGQVARELPRVKPDFGLGIVSRARWLQKHLMNLELCLWAELAAREIIAQGALVADVVAPPENIGSRSVGGARRGTARAVVGWMREYGVNVSRARVLRWMDAGVVSVFPDHRGRKLISFDEVLAVATEMNH